jgi:putative peptidoglycan lipid II flippase
LIRVVLTTVLGYLCAIPLPRAIGVSALWGAAGLTASAGAAGWVEMLMLRRTLNERIGRTGLPAGYVARLWTAALAGAAAAWAVKLLLPPLHPAIAAVAILGVFGVVFVGGTLALRVPEARSALRAPFARRASTRSVRL